MLHTGGNVYHLSWMVFYLIRWALHRFQRSADELPELFEPFRYDSEDAWRFNKENTKLNLFTGISNDVFRNLPTDRIRWVPFYLLSILGIWGIICHCLIALHFTSFFFGDVYFFENIGHKFLKSRILRFSLINHIIDNPHHQRAVVFILPHFKIKLLIGSFFL